jgi:hypothetical protein
MGADVTTGAGQGGGESVLDASAVHHAGPALAPRCVGAQGAQGAGAAPALSLLCYIALECNAPET